MVSPKKILFICGGNTCRSPMAKVILEQMLKDKGVSHSLRIESAAYDAPTLPNASGGARSAIKQLLGADLLADHRSKKLNDELVYSADIILVMGERMKKGLPPLKTWTLKEYAGTSGDISDPWNKGTETYVKCAEDIQRCLMVTLPQLIADLNLK